MKKGQTKTLQAVFTLTAGLMILIGIIVLFNNFIIPSTSNLSLKKNSKVLLELIDAQISKQYGILLEKENKTILRQMISIPKKINRRGYTIEVRESNFSEYFSKGGKGYWSSRLKLEVIEKSGRAGDHNVTLNLSSVPCNYKEARVSIKGEEIKWDNKTNNGNKFIIFKLNLEPNEIRRDVYLYCNNSQAQYPDYDVTYTKGKTNATIIRSEVKSQICMEYSGKKEEYCKTISAPLPGKGKVSSRENLIIKGIKDKKGIRYRLSNP